VRERYGHSCSSAGCRPVVEMRYATLREVLGRRAAVVDGLGAHGVVRLRFNITVTLRLDRLHRTMG